METIRFRSTSNTTLWLFSDTLVGEVKEGKRINSHMIHNSVALQDGTNRPTFFYGRTREGKPDSFIRPEHGAAGGYFWLNHGLNTKQGLYFFAIQVVTVNSKTPFGFKLVDGWLIRVANPTAPPAGWRLTQSRVPFTKISAKGSLIFGGSVMAEGGFLYVFGGDSRPEAKKVGAPNGLVVARVPADNFGDFDQWRFLGAGQWQKDFHKVTPLFANVGSEFSVTRVPSGGKYAAVYSEGIGGRIMLREAPALTGPWSDPQLIYRCPEMDWSSKVFCYAAKAHPEFAAGPDELLISYAANSWNFWDLFTDTRLYWPRFVRVEFTGK